MAEKQSALIMEGGAMRGMFTSGVIDVMMENGIKYDAAIGVSAGVTFGCNYKSEQIGRAIRYNKEYIADKRYWSFKNWRKTGDLFGVDFCYDELPRRLDVFDAETFTKNPMIFYAVATDVETGRPVYHRLTDGGDNDMLWIRASASLPMLSRIVEVDGYKLLDGGIADSIPVRFMEKRGYEHNVAILTRPFGYQKKEDKVRIERLLLRKYPNMVRAMQNRPQMYNETLDYIRKEELDGKLFVIRPPRDIDMPNLTDDPEVLQKIYDAGREAMTKRLDELKAYLHI